MPSPAHPPFSLERPKEGATTEYFQRDQGQSFRRKVMAYGTKLTAHGWKAKTYHYTQDSTGFWTEIALG